MKRAPRKNFLLSRLAAAVAGFSILSFTFPGPVAWSQTARTVKIVVPLAPGGAASVVARLLADEISRTQGVTTVVENRPGAGTAIATEAVSRAAPDGNTLLLTQTAFLANALLRKQNYDPLTSFEPLCKLVDQPNFIAVNSASPYRMLADFVVAARAKPGQLTLAAFTVPNIQFEVFKHRANIDIAFVPYAGSAPAVTALLGAHITSMIDNYATMAEYVNTGKLRVLATLSPTRVEGLAHIPAMAESGYNASEGWFGLFVPARTPNETVSQLISWTTAAMQLPDIKRKLEPLGLYPAKQCGTDFAAFIRRQYDQFGREIREVNLKVE